MEQGAISKLRVSSGSPSAWPANGWQHILTLVDEPLLGTRVSMFGAACAPASIYAASKITFG